VYLRLFPLAKYFRAFDLCISAAGYNSFHELIGFGVPTIFLANEHPMMDDQAARARFAMERDAAMWLVEEAVGEIGCALDLILREDVQRMIRAGCKALTPSNGAIEGARIVDALATGTSMSAADLNLLLESTESKAA
jgi:UDP-N-acetylglucosamine:LPS N-acetylglucosamine transferase